VRPREVRKEAKKRRESDFRFPAFLWVGSKFFKLANTRWAGDVRAASGLARIVLGPRG